MFMLPKLNRLAFTLKRSFPGFLCKISYDSIQLNCSGIAKSKRRPSDIVDLKRSFISLTLLNDLSAEAIVA